MYKKTETPLIMIKGKIVFCMDNKIERVDHTVEDEIRDVKEVHNDISIN